MLIYLFANFAPDKHLFIENTTHYGKQLREQCSQFLQEHVSLFLCIGTCAWGYFYFVYNWQCRGTGDGHTRMVLLYYSHSVVGCSLCISSLCTVDIGLCGYKKCASIVIDTYNSHSDTNVIFYHKRNCLFAIQVPHKRLCA